MSAHVGLDDTPSSPDPGSSTAHERSTAPGSPGRAPSLGTRALAPPRTPRPGGRSPVHERSCRSELHTRPGHGRFNFRVERPGRTVTRRRLVKATVPSCPVRQGTHSHLRTLPQSGSRPHHDLRHPEVRPHMSGQQRPVRPAELRPWGPRHPPRHGSPGRADVHRYMSAHVRVNFTPAPVMVASTSGSIAGVARRQVVASRKHGFHRVRGGQGFAHAPELCAHAEVDPTMTSGTRKFDRT